MSLVPQLHPAALKAEPQEDLQRAQVHAQPNCPQPLSYSCSAEQ